MTTTQFLQLVKKYRPATAEAFAKLKIKLVYIDEGAFRKGYRVSGLPLVVKIPIQTLSKSDTRWNKRHSAAEVRKIVKLQKFCFMRRHLPKVYYFDGPSGVLIVKYYDNGEGKNLMCQDENKLEAAFKFTQRRIRCLTGVSIHDISMDNLRMDRGEVKFIDLAL